MSADTGFSGMARGLGRNALDVPVAALAGLAIAYAVFAISPEQLAGLVAATGLPEVLPAAEPPLGNKARIGLAVGSALFIFILLFGLLRALDRKPRVEKPVEFETPRLRRRDHHPDAPACRPISATLEFGEPESIAREEAVVSQPEAVPAWLAPAEILPETLPEGPQPLESSLREEIASHATPELSPQVIDVRAALKALEESEAQPEPQTQLHPQAAPQRPVVATARTESIAELMVRLEQGLARRQPATDSLVRSAPVAPAEPAPRIGPDDDRLQSAIDSLQRFASRQA